MSLFQSTLPHGERRGAGLGERFGEISIHAPAWGATCGLALAACVGRFQSTLPHGERLRGFGLFRTVDIFQSTLPHGERLDLRPPEESVKAISIHAPAWGATDAVWRPTTGTTRFQSTLPHGERRSPQASWPVNDHFNPRSRMGSDHPTGVTAGAVRYFNPRSRMGSDGRADLGGGNQRDFNPRSRMGSDSPVNV